jgi:murein DD-endopeptidase MepM/ murein hydrolase activator NlpD
LALTVAGGTAALLGAILGPLFAQRHAPYVPPSLVRAAPLAASFAATEGIVDAGAADSHSGPVAASQAAPTWRVGQLASDDHITLSETALGHRPLLAALSAAHVARGEAMRVAKSLGVVRSADRLSPKDTLTVAVDKTSQRVVAYELAATSSDVWQGREQPDIDGSLKLETRKLDLKTEHIRVGRAVLVGSDLHASFLEAGLTPVEDVLSMLDDALDGHAEVSDIRPGARLRIVGTQELVDGVFARWVSLDAVEYFPAVANAAPVRVYAFVEGEGGSGKRHYYDAKGRQPFHGGWRSPVPFARIASRFNPHRMHPVLHVVMPHNGVDFAAPTGAPVYATAAGVVLSAAYDGPCGNKIEISHSGGMTSVYCHLSRFAPSLRVGQHVEQRQLIGYVGQTGRVTGPHLHFGIRQNGVFVDPMTLRLDGVRVIARASRDEFETQRLELDKELDQIALPAPSGVASEATEPETFYEEP